MKLWQRLILFATVGLAGLFGTPDDRALSQPCQWSYTLPGNVATAFYCGNVDVAGSIVGNSANTVATIAALVAIPVPTNGAGYYVIGYLAGSNKGGGSFVYNSSSALTPDGCTIFNATAGGQFLRINYGNQLDLFQCGAAGNGITNDTTAIQNLENAAGALGVTAFYPQGQFELRSPGITMVPGVVHVGQGYGYNGSPPISHIHASGFASTAWCYSLQNPNGTAPIEAPKFYSLWLDGCTNGIQYNTIAGGFTNDATTQEPFYRPWVIGVEITGTGTTGIGIQFNKTLIGRMEESAILGGGFNILVDLEGSDHFILHHNDLGGGQAEILLANAHNTFGSNLLVNGQNRFEQPASGANYIVDNYESAVFDDNYFEGPGTNPCAFQVNGGFSVTISNNNINSGLTNWLCVNDTSNGVTGSGLVTINAFSNWGAGAVTGQQVTFNSNTGIAYFANNSGARRKINHLGNFEYLGDDPWPMNSIGSSVDGFIWGQKVLASYSCNTDGLQLTGFGPSVICNRGDFVLTSTGSGNALNFTNTDRPNPAGTVDLWIFAKSTSGTSTLNACVLNAGSCVSGYTTSAALGVNGTWVNPQSSIATTNGGASLYANTNDVSVTAVLVVQH